MSKNISIKLTKLGSSLGPFSIITDTNKIVAENVRRKTLIEGVTYIIDDESVISIKIISTGNCNFEKTFLFQTLDKLEYANASFSENRTSCVWKHLDDTTIYNSFYGYTYPYIIEHPFSYRYQDQIVQNVIDHSKVYKYSKDLLNTFDRNNKIKLNDVWFNKAILYNDQQSTGILNLSHKPENNLNIYSSYPKYNKDSKDIIYTKSDNFYQYNTFWSVVKDKDIPLFLNTCENLSIDKEVNQSNMDYSKRTYKKATLRAKDLKIRHILDNRNDINIISQFINSPSQISHK